MSSNVSKEKLNVAIFSSGFFGTALTMPLSKNALEVYLHFTSPQHLSIFNQTRENRARFPGIALPENVVGFSHPQEVLDKTDVVILAVPSRAIRKVYTSIHPLMRKDAIVVSTAKGIETGTCLRPSQILREVNPRLRNLAVLSGPNYAHEIMRGLPAGTVVASENEKVAKTVHRLLKTEGLFIPFITDDVVGVELGGVLKNLIAISVGIADGMHMGSNGSALLKNRALREAGRLVVFLHGDERTMLGLAGEGDASLSSEPPGRNYMAGVEIGQGADPESLKKSGKTIEGLDSVEPVIMLARKYGVEVLIFETLYKIISKQIEPFEAIDILMSSKNIYEDPQPIDRRLKLPWRFLNRCLHVWGRLTP